MNVWAVYLSNQLYSLYETEEQAKEALADLKKGFPRRNSYYLRHIVNKKSA